MHYMLISNNSIYLNFIKMIIEIYFNDHQNTCQIRFEPQLCAPTCDIVSSIGMPQLGWVYEYVTGAETSDPRTHAKCMQDMVFCILETSWGATEICGNEHCYEFSCRSSALNTWRIKMPINTLTIKIMQINSTFSCQYTSYTCVFGPEAFGIFL